MAKNDFIQDALSELDGAESQLSDAQDRLSEAQSFLIQAVDENDFDLDKDEMADTVGAEVYASVEASLTRLIEDIANAASDAAQAAVASYLLNF